MSPIALDTDIGTRRTAFGGLRDVLNALRRAVVEGAALGLLRTDTGPT